MHSKTVYFHCLAKIFYCLLHSEVNLFFGGFAIIHSVFPWHFSLSGDNPITPSVFYGLGGAMFFFKSEANTFFTIK